MKFFLWRKKIVELSTNYEYRDEAIHIKINYSLLKQKNMFLL
jgi:predicted kinase